MEYKNTGIWKRSFGAHQASSLEAVYEKAWRNACQLASKIAADANGLTLHDERHFTRLWQCADMIVGDAYELNVLEVFILGVAILVHDAAHTVIAYEGGLDAIRQTSEWQDNLAVEVSHEEAKLYLADPNAMPEGVRKRVLFNTVRGLHAQNAKSILSKPFRHPAFGSSQYLIDDFSVRSHLGPLIGDIAASHHWNISSLPSLGRQKNVGSEYNSLGPVRPMLIAALMRTADAIQIDSGRASDFEFALAEPTGVSLNHWAAQNRLSVDADLNDPESLLITNSVSFTEKETAAWWVAYDLALTADKELRAADQFLRDEGFVPFKLRRVRDIATPEAFAKHVTAQGWVPVNAEVKINDTAKIVEMLGGKGLYGNSADIPLRELIQNSVDAIRARRLLEHGFKGKITVDLKENPGGEGKSSTYSLRVSDDGIGMSRGVLTGPFIAFGDSGWKSSELKRDYPGFQGRYLKTIGKFGIGFFSVFMSTGKVDVTTRQYNRGSHESNTLSFNGLKFRPSLHPATRNLGMSVVTEVELTLDEGATDQLLKKSSRRPLSGNAQKTGADRFSLAELLGFICVALDVDIEVTQSGQEPALISGTWCSEPAADWIKRIVPAEGDGRKIESDDLDKLDLITLEDGEVIGRAMLSPGGFRGGVNTIGGFYRRPGTGLQLSANFIGAIDAAPNGPRREFGYARSRQALSEWAERQVTTWRAVGMSDERQNFVAANAAHFGADAGTLANCLIDNQWRTVEEAFEMLKSGETLYAPIKSDGFADDDWMIMDNVNRASGAILRQQDVNVTLKNVIRAGHSAEVRNYWCVFGSEDEPPYPFSFVGCLTRLSLHKGRELVIEGGNIKFGTYTGGFHPLLERAESFDLTFPAAIFTLEPNAATD